MANVSVATITQFLKGQFKPGAAEEIVLKASASPFYQLMKKDTKFGGEYLKIPVIYGMLPSGSATFSTAQTNRGGLSGVAFKLESENLRKDYTVFGIDGVSIRVGKSNAHAFFNQLDKLVKAAYITQGRRRAIQCYRSNVGDFSTIHTSTNTATTTLIFANRGDSRCIEKGHTLQFLNPSTNALRSATALTINTVNNRTATQATVTLSATPDSLSASIATADKIIHEGDRLGCISGLLDWIPESAPGATAFFTVARNVDAERLGGLRLDCSGKTVLAALIEGISLCCELGSNPSHVFLPPELFRKAKEEVRGSTTYQAVATTEQALLSSGKRSQMVSVAGFAIDGDKGPVKVYSDWACPATRGFIVELDLWTLHSAGEDPGILMEDGNKILREADADAYQGRVGGYIEMSCAGPGNNMHLYNMS